MRNSIVVERPGRNLWVPGGVAVMIRNVPQPFHLLRELTTATNAWDARMCFRGTIHYGDNIVLHTCGALRIYSISIEERRRREGA